VTTLRELSDRIQSIPGLKTVLQAYYERIFSTTGHGMFRGVYGDFAEALRAAPRTKKVGFNHEEFITFYQDRLLRVFAEDYPVLFWLRPILSDNCRVFDFGGNRGHHFFSYARYLEYPKDFSWTVCEVPVVAKAGEELARERNETDRLKFTTDFRAADGATIFLAAGSLHYIEAPPLADALAGLRCMPRHLILNKVPLYGGKPYVTLQNGRVAFHPLHVFNRDEFVRSIHKLGYEPMDEWQVLARHGRIPFHPEASFPAYSGLYFRMRNS
jgi:putative methyltransferase (TIGR04325 family)